MGENLGRILITDDMYADYVNEVAQQFPQLTLVCVDESGDALALADGDFVGMVTQFATVDEPLLAKLSGLKVVLKNGRSYYNIDVDAVRSRNLTLASIPRKGPNCVAELALTLILALSKDLLASHAGVADGAYRYRGIKPILTAERKIAFRWMHNESVHEIFDKTLGIIGMGEIGCELARRTSVMGMTNIYHKRTPLSAELEARFEASYRDLETLLKESDYICVALPHTPESEKLIDVEALALMKESAYLVNIARGGILDEEALIEALQAGQIAGAGLDAFVYEPLPDDSPLCTLDNVILTPHIGGGTGTTRPAELSVALAEMVRILSGEAPRIDLS
ncbi:MAG: NAD(P)-dependent oxidoreductase [Chloroflexota bacterium]